MTYDKTFVNKLAQEALVVGVPFNDYWVKVNCEKNICKFISDIITNEIKNYTKDDWERVCEEAKETTTYQSLFYHRGVPKWLFDNFATTMDAKYALLRDDLLPSEMRKQVSRLSSKELKEFIKKEHGKIPNRTRDFLAKLPNGELAELEYLPLTYIYDGLHCFGAIQSNFPELYENDEKAMTAIVNNAHMGNDARLKAFNIGCDYFSIHTYSPEIATRIYESSIETITAHQEFVHPKYKSDISDMMCKMIQEDTLPVSCQIDLAQRINNDEICEDCSGWLTRALALHSHHDVVTAILAAPLRQDVMTLIAENPNAGADTYDLIYSRVVGPDIRKPWLTTFLAHNKILYDNALIDGFKFEDHELCKILSSFHGNSIFNNKYLLNRPIQEEYKFYHDFARATRVTYEMNDRGDSVIKLMLESNYEQPMYGAGACRLDATGTSFISYEIFTDILKKIEPLNCITEAEASNIKNICDEMKKKYRDSVTVKKHIKNFELKIEEIMKREKFRRQNLKFFCQKPNMNYEKDDEYRFNINYILKTDNEAINQFIKNIKKTNDIQLVRELKENLVRDSVNSVTRGDAHAWILIANKISPIYQALEEREKKLGHSFGKMMDGFSKAIQESIGR